MKPLRWFGYKIEESEVYPTISKALKPLGIVLESGNLHLCEKSYFRHDQFGRMPRIFRHFSRPCTLRIYATPIAFEKLKEFMNTELGFKFLSLHLVHPGVYPFGIEIETWNDFDSIENFLRANNDAIS